MKYIDAEKLIAEIDDILLACTKQTHTGVYNTCHRIKGIITSLQQEQPEVDLEKEIKEWADLMVGASFPEQDGDFISEEDYRSVIRQTAIHFLGLNARKEENK